MQIHGMKPQSLKNHMKPYRIHARRSTTISHAFASAMAPIDSYDATRTMDVLHQLECIVDDKIHCVYCGEREAQTWDHLFALVERGNPSGHGHTYGNLVPSCKDCNSVKGNKPWEQANEAINRERPAQRTKVERVLKQHVACFPQTMVGYSAQVKSQLDLIKAEILQLMKRADELIAREVKLTGA